MTFPRFLRRLSGDSEADRMVPPTGFTVRLTVFSAAGMAFLAVFAMALSFATDRLADRWASELARTSTLRIIAPQDQEAAQMRAAINVLETTPGVASARALSDDEQRALLEPWFGPDLPLENLPIPRLVEIVETDDGYDATGLRARLQAEVPGAILDDHTRWREPLVRAANRLRLLGLMSLVLISALAAAMISLGAQSALSANRQVIKVMRLVGARDDYIAGAFIRRFSSRAIIGALIGTLLGMGAIFLLPSSDGGFLTGLGFQGAEWISPFIIPILAWAVAYLATRFSAYRSLKEQS
jgi:cell division transport system permease protein